MGKKLAIRGHATRGKEVIELLEMMGGEAFRTKGNDETAIYVIPENGIIDVRFAYQKHIDNYAIFTLEEFLEKYPYKVGDKVHIYVQIDDFDGMCDVKVTEITSMRWNPVMCEIAYKMKNINREFYKEEIKCKVDDDSNNTSKDMEEKKINQMSLANCDLDEVEIVLGDKFELKIEDGKYYAVRKKLTYPTTYAECCKVLDTEETYMGIGGHKGNLLIRFQRLLICRDAYWKIAGEELGLGKPWEPDFNSGQFIPAIIYRGGFIQKVEVQYINTILAFPTTEMRNAFYENFKNLIEQCKELL